MISEATANKFKLINRTEMISCFLINHEIYWRAEVICGLQEISFPSRKELQCVLSPDAPTHTFKKFPPSAEDHVTK